MIGRLNKTGGGGGIDIQGIIEQYKVASGENVSAGDFVEFVNKYGITVETDTSITDTNQTSTYVSAVLLSENKVFIAHSYTNSYYLYGIVCTINGTTITRGTDTQLSNNSYSGQYFSVVVLNENKVFIVYSSGYIYGAVCTIDGTSITKSTDMRISYFSGANKISTVLLEGNKVFVAYGGIGSKSYLYGIICTISGTSITVGTETKLDSDGYSGYDISAVLLSENKVFVAHSDTDTYRYLYGVVCTIDGTSITKGTDTIISTSDYSGDSFSAVALNENTVFFAYKYDKSYQYIRGIVCKIDDMSIVFKSGATEISSYSGSGYNISAILISKNKVVIVHHGNNYCLYGIICTINELRIICGTDTELNNSRFSGVRQNSIVKLSNDKIFIAHNSDDSNYYLYGNISSIEKDNVKRYSTMIDGIAKESGTSGNTIDVYVPDIS